MKRFKLSKKTRHIAMERPKRSKKTLWAIIIAGIMAFSIIGYIYIGPGGDVDYNGFAFSAQGNPQTGVITGWTATIDGREISFTSHPRDVLFINVSEDIARLLRSARVLILTSDPEDESKDAIGLVGYDFQTLLGPAGVTALIAFTANNTFGRPIITCANATAYEPVLYLRSGEANRVSMDGGCITAEASSKPAMIRMRDRLLYAYFNVIP